MATMKTLYLGLLEKIEMYDSMMIKMSKQISLLNDQMEKTKDLNDKITLLKQIKDIAADRTRIGGLKMLCIDIQSQLDEILIQKPQRKTETD